MWTLYTIRFNGVLEPVQISENIYRGRNWDVLVETDVLVIEHWNLTFSPSLIEWLIYVRKP